MEMQWNQKDCQYLRCNVRQAQNLEQTRDLRLPEGMPDIGRVLCAWGQCMVREKEWRSDCVVVSGGVTAWVLYVPEDGSEVRSVELWLPFSGKWNFQDSHREGAIRVSCRLKSVDARTLSARKLMVRATVGVLTEALEMDEATLYSPGECPDALQLLTSSYPAMLPVEAGEKQFFMEEAVPLAAPARKILACVAEPAVSEQNAAGGKAVFRGICRVHTVYMGEDDRLRSEYYDLPMAQLAELEHDYDKDAAASVTVAVTNLETELEDGRLQLKCGMTGQYVIYARTMLETASDAYSPFCCLTPQQQSVQLPVLLEHSAQKVQLLQELEASVAEVVDITLRMEHPTQYREGDTAVLELPYSLQALYYDEEGDLRCDTQSAFGRLELPAGEETILQADLFPSGQPSALLLVDKIRAEGAVTVDLVATALQRIPMLTGLEIGEQTEPDPARPSLILRRAGGCSLWEIAKACGSTVEAIEQANHLTGDPAPEQMLLIPVL